MKYLIFFFLFILLSSCNQKYHNIVLDRVSNLNEATSEDMIKRGTITWNKSNEPEFYFFSGQKINSQEFSTQLQTNTYKQVFFFDDLDNLKVIILEPLDVEDLKLNQKANEKILDVGYMMPNFKAKDINGQLVDLNELKGKVIVLNFWFIKCPPCREEIPELNRLKSDFSNDSIEFISIATDSDNSIKEFLKEHNFNYRHISGKNILKDFNNYSYPTNIVLNAYGEIIYLEIGGRKDIYNQIKQAIEKASR